MDSSSESKPISVDDLLLLGSANPFSRLAQFRIVWEDVKELDDFQKLVEGDSNVDGLKELIVESLDANQNIEDFVTKVFEKYPELFAEFIWDLSSYPPLETLVSSFLFNLIQRICFKMSNWIKTFVERRPPSQLGDGSAGMVLASWKSGADPVLLGNLDWDVTDLILPLTRKDRKERPNVSLLIRLSVIRRPGQREDQGPLCGSIRWLF